ncbi:hypothetical protein EKH83_14090 [Arcticibacter tournemirensis]|uniref:Histidine kinase domain-containing protein n=2 Tax=Arcticibacter tournemirensis TaxID=699437 RepID=A0A4Q0M708_9SPHI|nr:hypothetical protein EKH83_14090 [Arcticibacter tournemirensis]
MRPLAALVILLTYSPRLLFMKKYFFFFTFICLCGSVMAQQLITAQPDSLELALKKSKNYKERAKALADLSDFWIYTDSSKSMNYALQVMAQYRQHNDKQGIGIGHYYIAGVYMENGNSKMAETEFRKAVNILTKDTSYLSQHYLARVWHNLGVLLQREGDAYGYLNILLNKAVPILESIKDTITLARNYNDIGAAFQNTQQFDKSLSWYKKAIKTLQHFPKYEDLALAYLGAARALLFKEDFSEQPSRQIKAYLDQAAGVLKPNPKAYPWIDYYTNEGLYYLHIAKRPDLAIRSYDQGILLAQEKHQEYPQLELLNRKYYLYYKQGDYKKARTTAYQLYKLASKYPISKNRLIILKNLVDAEEKNGNNARAFQLLKQYTALADSLKVEETNIRLNELEKKYEQQTKEKKILQLQADNSLKSAELDYNRTLLLSISGLLISVIILSVLVYLLHRNKQKLREKQKEMQQEQLFFDALNQGQEQERKRLAGDLHDGLGGLLSNIKLLISKETDCDESNSSWDKQNKLILQKLDNAMNELRRIARNLMPETLLRFGLATALRDYCEDLEKSGVKISLQTYGIGTQHDKNELIMIYRIMQELISNAIKHADAETILVQCIQNDEKIFITIEDDGKGFDKEIMSTSPGLGLSTVRNRVAYLKGSLDIQSKKDVGTTINIEFNAQQTT